MSSCFKIVRESIRLYESGNEPSVSIREGIYLDARDVVGRIYTAVMRSLWPVSCDFRGE